MPSPALTRDSDLRLLVHEELLSAHGSDEEAVIADEFSVCRASARMDVALINGSLAGFELKSDADRLYRLASQIPHYALVFDELTLVCAPRHLNRALRVLPACWGVWVADPSAEHPLTEVRPVGRNVDVSPHAVAGLLWHEEMLEVLHAHDLAKGMLSKPRRRLIDALVADVEPQTLVMTVREYLRARLSREGRAVTAS